MMTMAPGIEAAAAGPHGRAAAAAAAAAAAWYQQGTYDSPAQMHHSVPAGTAAPGDPSSAGHPAAHGGHEFFASSADAASRYYQMHYEASAASQGN